jgi:hypothetical protein
VIVSPKRARVCEPMNNETAISTNPPMPICQANFARLLRRVRGQAQEDRRHPKRIYARKSPRKTVKKLAASSLIRPQGGLVRCRPFAT